MPILKPEEYDISYFDGDKSSLRHNAGYSSYERWHRIDSDNSNSTGEFFKDKAKKYFDKFALSNKKILEVGCAKGFIVEDLRSMGVDAWGLDVSSYAISEASELIKPFLIVGDARTALTQFSNNQFDVVFSLRTLECFSDEDMSGLITEMNRISKFQFHVIDEQVRTDFYNVKQVSEWKNFGFRKNSILISNETLQEIMK